MPPGNFKLKKKNAQVGIRKVNLKTGFALVNS